MSQTRLISVRKSEPNQIVVYNLDRKNRTEIPARENTGTVQLSDPSEPVRSSPGSWPPDSGDAYKSITDLRNFQSWRRSMQPEAMLDLQTIRHVEMPCFFSAKSTCCVKLHKTAENVGAKSEKCLCEQLRCPKHAERGKSTRRFKFRFRLSAAEQAKAHISSLDRVAVTGHACANMRSQENQQDASEPVSD